MLEEWAQQMQNQVKIKIADWEDHRTTITALEQRKYLHI